MAYSLSSANGQGLIKTKKFYLEYRLAIVFAKETPDADIPKFSSIEQWEPFKSTKTDVCARICRHLLSRDDAPEAIFEDGKPVFPQPPILKQGEAITQDNRILVYQEFTSLCGLLRQACYQFHMFFFTKKQPLQVLKLYGVECLHIDGQMSFEQRSAVVTQFHAPNSPRVLIFSSVGSAGLNLSIANTVIFLVNCQVIPAIKANQLV